MDSVFPADPDSVVDPDSAVDPDSVVDPDSAAADRLGIVVDFAVVAVDGTDIGLNQNWLQPKRN